MARGYETNSRKLSKVQVNTMESLLITFFPVVDGASGVDGRDGELALI